MADAPSETERNAQLRGLVAFSAARSYSVNTNNPLDVIIPLFEPIATRLHKQQFSAAGLASELATRYDMLVSEEVCNYWSAELIKRRLLVPASDLVDSGAYVWNQESVVNVAEGEFAKELTAIIQELREFLKGTHDLIFQSYSDDDLASVLRRGAIGSLFPRLYEKNSGARSDDQYIFSRFVQFAGKNKPEIVESLSTLRRAAILCDLILNLREPRRPPASPQQVSVYFDSPLVMDLIGLGGLKRQDYAKRLLSGFQQLNFAPLINPDMVFEIGNNLKGLLSRAPGQRYGPTAEALRRVEFKIDFVDAVLSRLELQIEEAGIRIDRNFENHIERSDINEALETDLLAALQSHYTYLPAAERDARTIRGVFGRRGTPAPRDLYGAKSIFITSNDMLAAITNKFFRDRLGYKSQNFPIIVTRTVTAAMTDVIVGISASGSMSFTDMLVSAADATQYNVDVFSSIENHLKQMYPAEAEELIKILGKIDYSQMAMDVVRGNPRNVTAQAVSVVAENVRSRLEAEAESKVAAVRQAERKAAVLREAEHVEIQTEQKSRLALAEQELRHRHGDIVRILTRNWRASRERRAVVGNLTWIFGTFIGVFVGISVYFSGYYIDYMSKHPEFRFAMATISALGAGVPLAGLPSVRQWLLVKFNGWEDAVLISNALSMGYSMHAPTAALEEDFVAALNRQFDSKLLPIVGPMSGAPLRGDLFDS